MKKYALEFIVFVAGAVVMVLELTGSRVLAPYVGTSIYVWTSLIGIILGSLAIGYFWGGRLADKNPNVGRLGFILFGAGVWVGFIGMVESIIIKALQTYIVDIRIGSTLATMILFALPSMLLGAVLPFSIRLRMNKIVKSGTISGEFSAISTLGSILGTFLAGFWLISFFGSRNILFILSVITLLLSGVVFLIEKKTTLFILVILAILVFILGRQAPKKSDYLLDVDTQYNRVLLKYGKDLYSERGILSLSTGPGGTQSAMFLDNTTELVFPITKYFDIAEYFNPNISRALMIGGAGYSYPKHFLKTHKDSYLDVVEIDPGMTNIARKYFDLRPDPKLTIYHEDGRTFLNRNLQKYDSVYIDVFAGDLNIPFHLTTVESIERLYKSLTENGVVVMNVISSTSGERSKFLWSEYKTFKEYFPQVYLFATKSPNLSSLRQNIALVAHKSQNPVFFDSKDEKLEGLFQNRIMEIGDDDVGILTDDFAPVEYYMLSLGVWNL